MTSVTRALACAFAVVASSGTSFAQTSADVSLARQLGNDGLALAVSGDCAGAVEKLERAESLHHAPTTLTVLGECHLTLGKLVDGVEELTRVVREDLGPRPNPAFRKAQARARKKLEEARPRLAKLRITLEGGLGGAQVELRIDGQAVSTATLGLDRPIDPGAHDVEISAAGYKTASAHFVMREGVSQSWKVSLEPAPVAAAPPPEPAAPGPPPVASETATPVTPREPPKATYLPAGILLGVGVAGIAAGSVLGVLTLDKASHLASVCQPRSDCPSGEQGDISSANTLALGSTIAFGVGAVGAVLGTYFLAKPPRKHAAEASSASASIEWTPWIAPGSAGLAGRF